MGIEHETFIRVVGIGAVTVPLKTDVLLIEVEAIDGVGLQVSRIMLLSFIRFVETDKVVVLLQLAILLQSNRCDINVRSRRYFNCTRLVSILQFSHPFVSLLCFLSLLAQTFRCFSSLCQPHFRCSLFPFGHRI